MTEFELIDRLKPLLPLNDFVVAGAGDDCAILDLGAPELTLLKTDAVVEGIHFTPATEPDRVGHKALGRCLSDVAAMAGWPIAAVVTLGLPGGFDPARIEGLYRGLCRLASRYQVAVVGGETTSNPERLLVSVSVVGRVARDRVVRRSGLQPGDALFVTGELGGSFAGRHLDFEPRLTEAQWLAETVPLRAMMDLSDGLAGDLPHLLAASGGHGAALFQGALPVSRAAKTAARAGDLAKPAIVAALTDGEDFELLFGIAPGRTVALVDSWKLRFPDTRLSCIGRVTREPGIRLWDKNGVRPLNARGYEHFR